MKDNYIQRRSMRLSHFDYRAEGYYFVTFCVKSHASLLGCIHNGVWEASSAGHVVEEELFRLNSADGLFRVEACTVMPNHVHLLLSKGHTALASESDVHWLSRAPEVTAGGAVSGTLGVTVARLKAAVTRRIGLSIWQRGYYDRIVRTQEEYERIVTYIHENRQRWGNDCFHPRNR